MGEERTLAFARAPEVRDEELSKEELQLRMEETRDSITQTVTEIKETVLTNMKKLKTRSIGGSIIRSSRWPGAWVPLALASV